MNVREMLNDKGRDVFAVDKDSPLREAIKMLNARNIGVVLVTDKDGKMAGILSERDIIRRSLAQETGFRDESVSKSMTKNVISASEDDTVEQVMDVMTKSRIRHIPVLDGKEIKGLISIGDVVKWKIRDAETEAAALRDYITAG